LPAGLIGKETITWLVRLRRARNMRINDDVSFDRDHVFARQSASRIAVVDEPIFAINMAHQNHDVVVTCGYHSRRGRGTGEFSDPIWGQVKIGLDLTEHVAWRFAAAKRVGATGRPAPDDAIAIRIGHNFIGYNGSDGPAVSDPARARLIWTAALIADDNVANFLGLHTGNVPLLCLAFTYTCTWNGKNRDCKNCRLFKHRTSIRSEQLVAG
jgi:hypothetical protein